MNPIEPVEIVAARDPSARLWLSCEHASNRLPAPWSWPVKDAWIRDTHWAYDMGARDLTLALCAATGAGAVLARFSRLLIDPNRPTDAPTLLRTHAEGRAIALNGDVDEAERAARLGYWRAYHAAVDAALAGSSAPVLFAIHSFTPLYEGERRELDIGVLFDRDEALARRLAAHLAAADVGVVRLNEPYSGREGLIYAAQRHADALGRAAIEIEVRQDRLQDHAYRGALSQTLAAFDW
jgi:predicted N-formylglutamate amidohydrolase